MRASLHHLPPLLRSFLSLICNMGELVWPHLDSDPTTTHLTQEWQAREMISILEWWLGNSCWEVKLAGVLGNRVLGPLEVVGEQL